ncbi:hypothetical protein [Arsenicibacter rosenii]|uniref:Uncharacterized protein n=1 Tax=Arsenicibacter rosenii TaxID=1750698 RepID=A0A1S2VIH7_9BACT|nr:hypothetical protein [Arsenicibacter rosenii]OIN58567.1 hypothetical protein BLX24_13410 [Arsenicibacter rosenii]
MYSLLAALGLLLLGLAGLLWISYLREQRYQDEVKSLQFELSRKQDSLQRLQEQLLFPLPDKPARDTSDGWNNPPESAKLSVDK